MAEAFLYLLVFLPIATGILLIPPVSRKRKILNLIVILMAAVFFVLSIAVLLLPETETSFAPFCGLGIRFVSGGFHAVLALLGTFLWLCSALQSPLYFEHDPDAGSYYAFYFVTLGALNGVFFASDFMTLFLFFEIMSVASYTWVAHTQTKEALKASETYLFISILGGLVMLMGLFLLYHDAGSLSFDVLRQTAHTGRTLPAAIMVLSGFGVKAGMFPLHVWLPRSHPVAPAPASALLSGILIKSGVFGIIALSANLFFGDALWGGILLTLALVTMTLGAVLALVSTDLKRTLACSSMSHIGFILTGVAMTSFLGDEGLTAASGTVLHMINHSIVKLTLFTAAGVIYHNTKTRDLNRLRGYGKGKPLLAAAFLSGACSLSGIPGFAGYISKTLLHEGIVEYAGAAAASGTAAIFTGVEWIFLISGGCTFAYMARLFYILFIAKPDHEIRKEKYTDKKTSAVLAISAVLLPLLGVTPYLSMNRIAAFCVPFFNLPGQTLSVNYFSFENLKGSFISIAVGIGIFAFIGMKVLTGKKDGKETFLDVWNPKLDLEYLIYRPVLRALSFLGAVVARFFASIGGWILGGILDLIFARAKAVVVPDEDADFTSYDHEKAKNVIDRSFSLDLLLAAIGIIVILAFLFFAV